MTDDRPYDPKNYLLPGAARTSGIKNPMYTSTYVFPNDFMALLPDTPEGKVLTLFFFFLTLGRLPGVKWEPFDVVLSCVQLSLLEPHDMDKVSRRLP